MKPGGSRHKQQGSSNQMKARHHQHHFLPNKSLACSRIALLTFSGHGVQMSVAEVGLVGEYIQATCCLTAADAIQGAVLSLQAAYLEGTGYPGLTTSPLPPDAALKQVMQRI